MNCALGRLLMACGTADLPAPEVCWNVDEDAFNLYWHDANGSFMWSVDVTVPLAGPCIYAWTITEDKTIRSDCGVADVAVPDHLDALVLLIETVIVKHEVPVV